MHDLLTESAGVLKTLNYLSGRVSEFSNMVQSYQRRVEELKQEHLFLKQRRQMIDTSRDFYQSAIDVMYKESKGELEKTLNLAMRFIFFDKKYEIRVDLEDRHGKSMDYTFRDLSGDSEEILEADIRICGARGVRSVVSLVSHVYYLVSMQFPFLFCDEAYTGLHEKYVDRFFQFIGTLCEEKGLVFVLITQDPRFMDYADRTYYAWDGMVEQKKDVEEEIKTE